MSAWASDQSLATPLLGSAVHQVHSNESTIVIDDAPEDQRRNGGRQRETLSFPRRLALLLAELKPGYHAILLAVISIFQSIVVAQGMLLTDCYLALAFIVH